jgi:hypothetical protein
MRRVLRGLADAISGRLVEAERDDERLSGHSGLLATLTLVRIMYRRMRTMELEPTCRLTSGIAATADIESHHAPRASVANGRTVQAIGLAGRSVASSVADRLLRGSCGVQH